NLPAVKNSTVQPDATKKVATPQPALPKAADSQNAAQDRKTLVRSQWSQCKAKTLPATTNLLWNVQITEGIPAKGTYAKGNLDSDAAFPVHVIIKSDSQIVDKIKAMLAPGKTAFLRGNCTEVSTDGSVVIQAF
ncbi:MAG: hypothetical protein PHW24_05035, partial [Candidatus Moranbacteria bacterium]|nr:hypothetical protein [Candidatus Moranbacteria bacterium]